MLRIAFVFAAACAFACPSHAQYWPQTTYLQPHGAVRGETLDVQIHGRNLGRALGVLVDRPGLRILSCKNLNDRNVVVRLQVAEDADLGARQIRLRTAHGLSGVELFRVGTHPRVAEREGNDSVENAQPIGLDVCVEGSLQTGDVDFYRVRVDRAMRLRAEVVGVRLGDSAIDPRLRILNADGEEILDVDDTILGRMDPIVAIDVTEAGDYYIAVRDSGWRGAVAGADYRLHVGRFVRPLALSPTGGRPGEVVDVSLHGDGEPTRMRVELRAEEGFQRVFPVAATDARGPRTRVGGMAGFTALPRVLHSKRLPVHASPTPLYLRVIDLPRRTEADAHRARKAKQSLALPAVFEGVLGKAGETDEWRFSAKKGQSFTFQGIARTLRSPADLTLYMRQLGGKFTAYGDDTGRSLDPRIVFRAPADGVYQLFVSDRLRRGGSAHVYRVEVARTRAQPSARILPAGRYEDHAVVAPRGAHAGFRLAITGVPVGTRVRLRGLPQGCRSSERITERGRSVLDLVVRAAPDAPLAGAQLTLAMLRPGQKEWETLRLTQPLELVRVANRQPYLVVAERTIPFAVAEAVPFALTLRQPKVPILQGSPMSLVVDAKRAPKFRNGMRVRILEAPPGVRANTVTLAKGEVRLSLSAATSARPGKHRVHAVARVYGRGSFYDVATAPIDLETSKRTATIRIGSVRGQLLPSDALTLRLPVDIAVARAWSGDARVELRGLPKGVELVTKSLPAKGLSSKGKQVALELEVAAKTRPGRFRNLLLRLRVPTPNGTLVEDWRGGELRLDPAPKAEVVGGGQ